MKEEYISIAEFAKKAGVSRQAIYSRLDSDLSTFLVIDNGKKTLNTRALKLFDVKENVKEVYNQEFIVSLKKNNELLEIELKHKNREIKQLLEENRKLSEQLLSLSDKIGTTLQTISQTQLADKMIEGQKMSEESMTVEVGSSVAATLDPEQLQPAERKKKPWWKVWK